MASDGNGPRAVCAMWAFRAAFAAAAAAARLLVCCLFVPCLTRVRGCYAVLACAVLPLPAGGAHGSGTSSGFSTEGEGIAPQAEPALVVTRSQRAAARLASTPPISSDV